MALEAEQRGQEVDTVGYGTHVSLISRICVLGHMQAMVEKRHAYLEPTPPGPAKSIVTMGTLIHVCYYFIFIVFSLAPVRIICHIQCFYARALLLFYYAHLPHYIPGPMCAPLPS